MARLTRLKIKTFRNVAPCELQFSPGFNLFMGLNGTGKTTLLDLIAKILGDDFSLLREEEFEIEYDLELDRAHVAVSLQNKQKRSEYDEDQQPAFSFLSAPEFNWSAEGTVTVLDPRLEYTFEANAPGVTLGHGSSPHTWMYLTRPHLKSVIGYILWVITTSEQQQRGARPRSQPLGADLLAGYRLCRFDESLDFFRLITANSLLEKGPLAAPLMKFSCDHSPSPEMAISPVSVDAQTPLPQEISLHANDVLTRIARSGGEPKDFSISADGLDFLGKTVQTLGFKTAELQVRLLEKKSNPAHVSFSFGDFRFMLQRADGSIISHERLSYGQKRLLAFYYYLAMTPHTVIADELVNGLHHQWIKQCLDAIGDRQAFLTSQNPLLLDSLSFESAKHVRSSFVVCRLVSTDGQECMNWSNMVEQDAEHFFEAYQGNQVPAARLMIHRGLL